MSPWECYYDDQGERTMSTTAQEPASAGHIRPALVDVVPTSEPVIAFWAATGRHPSTDRMVWRGLAELAALTLRRPLPA